MKLGWAAAADASALVIVDEFGDESEREIAGEDGHHLQRVRRLGVDEHVVVADGAGHWYASRVSAVGQGTLTVERVGETHVEPEPSPGLTIAFAPAKRDHGTEVVHQLVELGVDRIIPLITRRSVVRWDGERGEKAWARLQRVTRDASVQCHRARIPALDQPTEISALRTRSDLVIADRDGVSSLDLGVPETGEWCVIVGPEGGFAPEEIAMLHPTAALSVGPHVLRSVTAPVAIAAVLTARRRV